MLVVVPTAPATTPNNDDDDYNLLWLLLLLVPFLFCCVYFACRPKEPVKEPAAPVRAYEPFEVLPLHSVVETMALAEPLPLAQPTLLAAVPVAVAPVAVAQAPVTPVGSAQLLPPVGGLGGVVGAIVIDTPRHHYIGVRGRDRIYHHCIDPRDNQFYQLNAQTHEGGIVPGPLMASIPDLVVHYTVPRPRVPYSLREPNVGYASHASPNRQPLNEAERALLQRTAVEVDSLLDQALDWAAKPIFEEILDEGLAWLPFLLDPDRANAAELVAAAPAWVRETHDPSSGSARLHFHWQTPLGELDDVHQLLDEAVSYAMDVVFNQVFEVVLDHAWLVAPSVPDRAVTMRRRAPTMR